MKKRSLEEKKSDTIRCILSAATEVFAEVGFAGARVDEIARRANVNKAMIYYRIGDKEALYAQVLHDVFGDTTEIMAQHLKKEEQPEEKLKIYIRNVVRTVSQNPQIPSIMMHEIASGGENFPEVVIKDVTAIVGILAGILHEGTKEGLFAEANPFIVHMMVLGCIVFYKNMEYVRSKHPRFPQTLKKLDKRLPSALAEEIEKLVLKAVKK